MHSFGKNIFFADYAFHVPENVYEPAEDSFLFAENLEVRKRDSVIDIGTGCGILGVIAADKAHEVLVTDLNPYAVQCAKENARCNSVESKMLFVQGDLLAPIRIGKRFDVVLFNAPYLPSEEIEVKSWIDKAWTGGTSGRDVIDRFICEVPRYVGPDGRIFLMQSTLCGVDETLKSFQRQKLEARVVVKRDLPFFEAIVLVKACL